jgi:hypothetical protein
MGRTVLDDLTDVKSFDDDRSAACHLAWPQAMLPATCQTDEPATPARHPETT